MCVNIWDGCKSDVKSCLSFINDYVCSNKIFSTINEHVFYEKDIEATAELRKDERFAETFAGW